MPGSSVRSRALVPVRALVRGRSGVRTGQHQDYCLKSVEISTGL